MISKDDSDVFTASFTKKYKPKIIDISFLQPKSEFNILRQNPTSSLICGDYFCWQFVG